MQDLTLIRGYSDLADHLINADVLNNQISGGHNADNFFLALKKAEGFAKQKIEISPGIYKIEYQLPGSEKTYIKTIYDPAVYSDVSMTEMTNIAANKALIQYQITGNTAQKIVINGIEFSVPVRIKNGQPFVPTAFPIGVKK